MMFRFASVVEFLPHEEGSDQLPALLAAAHSDLVPPYPAYLGTDEDLATGRFNALRSGRMVT